MIRILDNLVVITCGSLTLAKHFQCFKYLIESVLLLLHTGVSCTVSREGPMKTHQIWIIIICISICRLILICVKL